MRPAVAPYSSSKTHPVEPDTLLDIHDRLRRDGIAVATIVVSRTVGEARAFWCGWMRERQRVVVVSPSMHAASGIAALRAKAPHLTPPNSGLLFAGPANLALTAATEAARKLSSAPIAVPLSTDALAMEISSSTMPASLLGDILKGLTPLSIEDGRILDVVASRSSTAPLLRSAFEGVLYYLLEARHETQGKFLPNLRIKRPGGQGADEVDLVAEDAKLAIEIDGGQHATWEHTRRDQQKDARLKSLGYEVLRFEARAVATQPNEVWLKIHQVLRQRGAS
jgi:very-short-patch-repair endonuclease